MSTPLGLEAEAPIPIIDSLRGIEERVRGLEDSLKELKTLKIMKIVGLWKMGKCKYFSDGRCSAWVIRDEFIGNFKELFWESSLDNTDGKHRLKVSNMPELCAICPLFSLKLP